VSVDSSVLHDDFPLSSGGRIVVSLTSNHPEGCRIEWGMADGSPLTSLTPMDARIFCDAIARAATLATHLAIRAARRVPDPPRLTIEEIVAAMEGKVTNG
jgi:hypothetical protein